jgi:hypothetical protein
MPGSPPRGTRGSPDEAGQSPALQNAKRDGLKAAPTRPQDACKMPTGIEGKKKQIPSDRSRNSQIALVTRRSRQPFALAYRGQARDRVRDDAYSEAEGNERGGANYIGAEKGEPSELGGSPGSE